MIGHYQASCKQYNCIRSSPPEVFLRKTVLKICNKFTGERPCRSAILACRSCQLYWNRTSAWMFSCEFAAHFQNTFFKENLWTTASGACKSNICEIKKHSQVKAIFAFMIEPVSSFFWSIISTPSTPLF